MPLLLAAALLTFTPLSGWSESGAPKPPMNAGSPTVITVTPTPIADHTPPIGVNDFGDPGGIRYSVGNLIPDAGFEPINIRRSWRVTRVGRDKGYPWIEVDGGGMTDWDLTTTGFLNGASYRLYRIVDARGNALPREGDYLNLARADRFVRVGDGVVPEAGARSLPLGGWVDEPGERRIYLDGAEPAVWDYIFFEKRTVDPDPAWSHPRLDGNGHSDRVAETWRPGWGLEEAGIDLKRRPHGAPPPPAMRFPGETAYRITSPVRGATAVHGPYIFFPLNDNPEGNWYGTLEPGETYQYEVWMRGEGPNGGPLPGGGEVELGFFSVYEEISRRFTVTDAWRRYAFEFTAPQRPRTNAWHGGPAIRFTGPGTLELDNVRLYRLADPGYGSAFAAGTAGGGELQVDPVPPPSPLVFDELLAMQPERGEKGILRSMYVLLNQATMASLLSMHGDAGIVYDWWIGVQGSSGMTLPVFLDRAYRTGPEPAQRMKPWLNVSSRAPEEEWLALMEYLAAPINPDDPADVAAKPWAALRYRQRGVSTPWTDEFPKIIIEFANETWHNGAVESEWDGWGRFHWVHTGGHEFGLWADFIGDYLRTNSPWFAAARDAGRIELHLGSNYQDYGETAIRYADEASAVGHTTYVGPRWETGEEPNTVFNDEGLQATLLGYVAGLDDEFRSWQRRREELGGEGIRYNLYAYEGGPSGYALPGSAPDAQVEIAERYGKSQAMAVASLDVWLGAYQAGFSEMAFLSFAQGAYWSSHTPVREGFRRHVPWLAVMLRNRYASGVMVDATVAGAPTLRWNGTDEPLIGAYAFRDGSRLAIFVLSRRMDVQTPITLRLPAAPTGAATLYALEADPAATNRHTDEVAITSRTVTLGRETTLIIPPAGIHLYVVDTAMPAAASSAPEAALGGR